MHYFLSESCFVYSVSDKLCIEDNLRILSIYKSLTENSDLRNKYKICDIVPAYNSIAFHFDCCDIYCLEQDILAAIADVKTSVLLDSNTHYIDVVYNGEDIQKVAKDTGLSVKDVIRLHSEKQYHIAMLGFKPYFPYLLGLDVRLEVDRLAIPRSRVNEGAIGIGGLQTTIFPIDTPSGWKIIGNSDFRDFSKFLPGDKIIFRSI